MVDKTFHIMFTVTFIEHYSLQKIFFFIEVEDRDMNIRHDYVKKNGKIINIHIILPQHKHYTHTHTHIHRDIIISTRGRNRARTHIQSHTRTHTHTYSL